MNKIDNRNKKKEINLSAKYDRYDVGFATRQIIGAYSQFENMLFPSTLQIKDQRPGLETISSYFAKEFNLYLAIQYRVLFNG